MPEKLASRKLWLTIAAMGYVVLEVLLGAVSPSDGIEAVKVIALGYLASQGIADAAGKFTS